MRKFIAIFLFFIIFTSSIFAYTPTDNDNKILNNLYLKLDNIGNNSSTKLQKLGNKIDVLKEKYKDNERIYFLLSQLIKYINDKYVTFDIIEIIDGDTIKLNYDGKEESFRLIGIDTPESYTTRFGYKECYGDEANKYLKGLLEGKNVKVEFDETQGKIDKYGRYLSYIFLDGININNEMIKNGYAWEYTYNKAYKYQDLFKTSQEFASNGKLGLWSVTACNGERKKVEEKTKTNSGSINSDNFVNTETSVGNFNCSVKKTYCTQMITCEEAKFYLNSCSLSRLDADKDGIPCENLCN